MINLTECKKRRVYKLISRNLSFGVFDGETRFVGIRTKFGRRMLDAEDHWDTGHPFGTAQPDEDTGIVIPEEISLHLCENEGIPIDKATGRDVVFDRPVSKGGKGWFFKDTGEQSENICPIAFENRKLLEFLEKIEKKNLQNQILGKVRTNQVE
jgi:hypothetical protein